MPNAASTSFQWPNGKRGALSISFDDARVSQMDNGIPVLDRHGVKGTFYVCIEPLKNRAEDWRNAAKRGHELGNHTVAHPCSGNFAWVSRPHALEEYTLARMETQLLDANKAIEELVGVKPSTFAYPCGQKFVGRGRELLSYVPLVAQHFVAGRGFRDEYTNDPAYCDLAQLAGADADRTNFAQVKTWIDAAVAENRWLVLAAHDVADTGRQAIAPPVLSEICQYAQDPASGVWVDTVAEIGKYVAGKR